MRKLVIATSTAALLFAGIGTATADPASTPSATAVSDTTTGSEALSSSSAVQAPLQAVSAVLAVFVCGVDALSGNACTSS